MARIGINYAAVAEAAAQVEGRGKLATVDAIRQILGTGSRTTIANHLKAWKARQPNSNHDGIPQELASLVKGLWERVQSLAVIRVQEIEQQTQTKIDEIAHQLNQERIDYQALDTNYKEIESRYHEQVKLTENYRDNLSQSDQHNAKLETYSHALQEQLDHHKAENDRLHKMNSRIQDNLDSAQNEIIKCRQENDSAMEKQRCSYNTEIQQLQQSVVLLTESNAQLEIEKMQLANERDNLMTEKNTIEQLNINDKTKLQESSLALLNLQAKYDTLLAQTTSIKQELKEKLMITIELERKNAVLIDQMFRLESKSEALDKSNRLLNTEIKQLNHEKLYLIEQMNQLQKV